MEGWELFHFIMRKKKRHLAFEGCSRIEYPSLLYFRCIFVMSFDVKSIIFYTDILVGGLSDGEQEVDIIWVTNRSVVLCFHPAI